MPFPNDFLWGAASASYQIEGAWDADDKVPSIWDTLSDGHIKHNDTGKVACDHYHRYKEDVALMKELGLKSYRFSISWPRVMSSPDTVNEKGLAFYSNLVDELLTAGIEPVVTLFHWDLPLWSHELGAWRANRIAEDFARYTGVVVDALSDRVSWWMTLNEPAAILGAGYDYGVNAPFERDYDTLAPENRAADLALISKNLLLAHGRSVQVIRERAKRQPKIGMALCGNMLEPEGSDSNSIEAARQATFIKDCCEFDVHWWADPAFLGVLPKPLQGFITPKELEIIHQPMDFFGINVYNTNNYVGYRGTEPGGWPGMPRTAMDWPITPDALYWESRWLYERYALPVVITENGMANIDFVMSDGKVHDPQRIEYLKLYLKGLERAIDEGYPILGYTCWSIMDNMEWSEGYDKRFGLIYVDFRTLKRTPKDSFYWYQKVIRSGGNLD